jgi:hypothetical protein
MKFAIFIVALLLVWLPPLNASRCSKMEDKVERLYSNMIYPKPIQVMAGQISVADIFDPQVQIRVTPWGKWLDYQGVLEFFYGIVSFPLDRVANVTLENFVCDDDLISVRFTQTDVFLAPFPLPPVYNLTHQATFRFDPRTKLITSGDLILYNPGAILNLAPVQQLRDIVINNTCQIFVGPSVYSPVGTCWDQWNGTTTDEKKLDCFNFYKSIDFGTWDRLTANSYVCRQFHALFTVFRPTVYCPVIGKTGGNRCVFTPYSSFYQEEFP